MAEKKGGRMRDGLRKEGKKDGKNVVRDERRKGGKMMDERRGG